MSKAQNNKKITQYEGKKTQYERKKNKYYFLTFNAVLVS